MTCLLVFLMSKRPSLDTGFIRLPITNTLLLLEILETSYAILTSPLSVISEMPLQHATRFKTASNSVLNDLSEYVNIVKSSESINVFKLRLKTELFSRYV